MSAEVERQAWADIVEALEGVSADKRIVEMAVSALAAHRTKTNRSVKRVCYRMLREVGLAEDAVLRLMKR